MTAKRSVGRFCSTTTKDLTSLFLLDAANMGFGAQALVLSTGRSYRFLDSAVATFSPVTVRASDNSGTWFQEDAIYDQSFYIYARSASNFVSVTQNVWSALPSGIGLYASVDSAACWSVNSSAGIATYNGPTAQFMVQARLSLGTDSELADSYEFDLARNGTVIGTTSPSASSTRTDGSDNGALWCAYMHTIVATPAGTTYQMVMRDLDHNRLIFIEKFQISFTLLP